MFCSKAACDHVQAPVCLWRTEVNLRCLRLLLFTLVFETGSLIEPIAPLLGHKPWDLPWTPALESQTRTIISGFYLGASTLTSVSPDQET